MRINVGILVVASLLLWWVWSWNPNPQFDSRPLAIAVILVGAGFVWFTLQLVAAIVRQRNRAK